jgi:hypothetical protein
MTDYKKKGTKAQRVAEAAPVQVFLDHADQLRLERLTTQLGASKSDVLRQSLAALERQLLDPKTHPALRLIGLVDGDEGVVEKSDVAVEHDRYLASQHDRPVKSPTARRRGRS